MKRFTVIPWAFCEAKVARAGSSDVRPFRASRYGPPHSQLGCRQAAGVTIMGVILVWNDFKMGERRSCYIESLTVNALIVVFDPASIGLGLRRGDRFALFEFRKGRQHIIPGPLDRFGIGAGLIIHRTGIG